MVPRWLAVQHKKTQGSTDLSGPTGIASARYSAVLDNKFAFFFSITKFPQFKMQNGLRCYAYQWEIHFCIAFPGYRQRRLPRSSVAFHLLPRSPRRSLFLDPSRHASSPVAVPVTQRPSLRPSNAHPVRSVADHSLPPQSEGTSMEETSIGDSMTRDASRSLFAWSRMPNHTTLS